MRAFEQYRVLVVLCREPLPSFFAPQPVTILHTPGEVDQCGRCSEDRSRKVRGHFEVCMSPISNAKTLESQGDRDAGEAG